MTITAERQMSQQIERALQREIQQIAQEPDIMQNTSFAPNEKLDLGALLALNGDDFITACYRQVLGREPDETGLQQHSHALAHGADKLMMVGALRYGREGRMMGRPIPGLPSRYAMRRVLALPVLGGALYRAGTVLRLPRILRNLRAGQDQQQNSLREMTAAIQQIQGHLGQVTRDAKAQVDPLLLRLKDMDALLAAEPWATPLAALAERAEEQQVQLAQLRHVASLGAAIDALKRDRDWPETGAALAQRFGALLADVEARIETNRRAMLDQDRRIGQLLAALEGNPALSDAARGLVQAEQDHRLDALYVAFEDRFRGSRDFVKLRQRVHLDLIRDAGAGTPDRPVIDVGSGRGEWMELLRDEGLTTRGVDLNHSMAEACTERGLACVQGDAVAYLAAMPEGSVGAVTGFHIIEHLPFAVMVALFDEALRVLQPGGVVLFETPNPANLLVGSRWFYLDPTHRNPLPGEMVAMIAEARGFADVEIRELHPGTERFAAAGDAVLASQLDKLFHGPQDYALVARKRAV